MLLKISILFRFVFFIFHSLHISFVVFQAKKLVESSPQILRDNLSKADAETMKAKIEAAGGICAIE